jgi:peroxiredoxin
MNLLSSIFMLGLVMASVNTGDYAPNFSLPASDGKTVSLSEFRGRLLYVTFVQRDCYPCQLEVPKLNEIAKTRANELSVIGVMNGAVSQDMAQQMKQDLGIEFPLLYDQDGKIQADYHIMMVPAGFLINERGRIVKRYTGFVENILTADMEQQIARVDRLKSACSVFVAPFMDGSDEAAAQKLGESYQALIAKHISGQGFDAAKTKDDSRFVLNGAVQQAKNQTHVSAYLDDMMSGKTVAVEDVSLPSGDFSKFESLIDHDLSSRCPSKAATKK